MKFKETETLEFKKSISELKDGIKSICAILNKHKEGKIIFGIKPDGKVIGQDVNEKTLRDVSKAISDFVEPKIFPKVYEEIIENKSCVVVDFKGLNVPYYAYGRAYMRVSDEDRLISAKELERLILEKNKDKLRWDSEVCEGAGLKDIDEDRLKWFLKESGKSYGGVEESLKKLNLLSEKRLSNAAVILFGKNSKDFFRNSKLRCAVFATEKTDATIDMKEYEGNLFDLVEEALKYFLKNIHMGMRIEGLKRIDVPEINKEAFREAVINAFCHRDYWNDDNVHLAIFKNRVEVRSPGLLYGDLTIEKIRKEEVSERRNELIAEMFHEVHFVERWGRGIGKILELEPKTEFKELGRKFYSVFKRKTREKTVEKTREKILELIAKNKDITQKDIAEEVGLTIKGVEWNLKKLKEKGLIRRVGSDKGGHWEAGRVGLGERKEIGI